jgi:uncharacterized membrane protein YfcA
MVILFFFLIGALSGSLAGLLGLGGGVIVGPALAAMFKHFNLIPPQYIMQMAIGTSLSTIIITFMASLYAHIKHLSVRWDFARQLIPGLMLGVLIGSFVAHDLPSNFLRIFFSIFLIAVAAQIAFSKNTETPAPLPSKLFIHGVALIIGMLSSILGVGGGVLLMPFLLRCQLNMRQATGTSVACGMGIGIAATVLYMFLGSKAVVLPWSTGYIYWPAFLGVGLASIIFAPLGTALAYRLPTLFLKRFLAGFLVLVAIEMILI